MNSSFELLQALKQAKYLPKDALEFWWCHSYCIVFALFIPNYFGSQKSKRHLWNIDCHRYIKYVCFSSF